LAGVTFFRPVEGQLIRPFSSRDQNYGIGLLLSKEEGIKATLDGSVVFAGYSISDKYFVCIQHANNMISWYKKMNRSLKSQGEFVRAGEVIGISGGEASGTEAINFEFQIWYNGNALDPADFLNF
jgi:septal ring factor EnvC (AmiA/AmiB activator)